MKCTNCGNDLPDGSKFCFSCGAKQLIELDTVPPEKNVSIQEAVEKEETSNESDNCSIEADKSGDGKFCPYCGAKNEVDSRFCCSCGKNMAMGQPEIKYENNTYQPEKKFPLKWLLVGIMAVGIVILLMSCINGGSSGESKYIAYIKDGGLKQINLDHYKKKPIEYGESYTIHEPRQYGYGADVKYSEDGSYIFYPTDSSDGTFQLNRQKNGGKGDSVKIDSNVAAYTVLKDNSVVYIKGENRLLYISDKKGNKDKIASDVTAYNYGKYYTIDEKEENIVWVEAQSDGKYSIYQQALALEEDKNLLAQNVDSANIGDNLTQITVLEGDELYIISDLKEKEKIDSDVYMTTHNFEKARAVYYIKSEDNVLTAADLVEDDCADTDASIEEPEYDDFWVETVEKDSRTGEYEKVEVIDEEAYEEAYDKYWEKYDRDTIRENLYDYEISQQMRTLYCYKNGEITEVDNAYTWESSQNDSDTLVYNRYNLEKIPKIKISEISEIEDIEDLYYKYRDNSIETCVYNGEDSIVLEETLGTFLAIDEENQIGYGMKGEQIEKTSDRSEEEDSYEYYDTKYSCYSFSIAEGSDGECELVAEDTSPWMEVKDGKIYTYSDYGDESQSCDLYCNGEMIDSNVRAFSLRFLDDFLLYIADFDDASVTGTLKIYDGKEERTIAEDVYYYKEFDEENIVVLTDYDTENFRGDLKYYRGKDELVELEQDVTFLFSGNWAVEMGEDHLP